MKTRLRWMQHFLFKLKFIYLSIYQQLLLLATHLDYSNTTNPSALVFLHSEPSNRYEEVAPRLLVSTDTYPVYCICRDVYKKTGWNVVYVQGVVTTMTPVSKFLHAASLSKSAISGTVPRLL